MANLDIVTDTTYTIEKTDSLARKIWLVSLGVYAKGFVEIQTQFEKINGERARLFKELVSTGEKFTANSKENIGEDVREETAVDKRVAEVRKKLGLDISNNETKIAELSKRVDELTEVLSKLS
jgi:septal ring factor EnvC (AmiA/AmiB activator)